MPRELPAPFDRAPFAVSAARQAGVTAGRLRSRDLSQPFHGVRVQGAASTLFERCRALVPRMRAGESISHTTAAALWGMPLPLSLANDLVHVTAAARAMRGRGIVGHSEAIAGSVLLDGVPVVPPAQVWRQLSTMMEWPDLVAVGDFLVTGRPFENILPFATADELEATHRASGNRGRARRRSALAHTAGGPFSRPESLSRVLFRLAGLPEGESNAPVSDARGSFLAMPDLGWPAYRVAYEYEGDHHRATRQFRADISRIERLVDHGWIVVKGSADDLFDRPDELVRRVARRLAGRGWSGALRELPRNVRFGR